MKLIYLLPLSAICSSFVLITDYSFINKEHPVHLEGEYRAIAPAYFYSPKAVKHSHVNHSDAYAALYYSHELTEKNALSWQMGYSYLRYDWNKNPRFRQDDYHNATLSLGWVSTSLDRWRWILRSGVTVDATTFNFPNTGVYHALVWGRYHYTNQVGMHMGFWGHYGVKNGYLLPILGIDWRISSKWMLYAIFPINGSLNYEINDQWILSLMYSTFGRTYRFPRRVHEGIGKFHNGIFEVYSSGAELDLKYHYKRAVFAAVGVGYNVGGWITIKDRHDNHGRYYKHGGAPYAQGKLMFNF